MKINFFKKLESGLCSTLSEMYETPITPDLLRDSRKLETVLERKRREKWESQAPEREREKIARMKEIEERKLRAEERIRELKFQLNELEKEAKEIEAKL